MCYNLQNVFKTSGKILTEREFKGYGFVSNFPINHGGLKQCPKQQEALILVCIKLDTETSPNGNLSVICQILY